MTAHTDMLPRIFDYWEEKAPILFFILSREGDVVKANRYARTLTGLNCGETRFRDLVIDFKGVFDLAGVLKDTAGERLLSLHTASGSPQSFYFSFVPTENDIFVFGRLDTDEIEAMRKEVLALNQELGNLTRRLHQQNAQLKRLNDEKNRFLGMAAHDLRKPIGAVMAYSEFLLDEARSLDEEQMQFLRTINASGTFMKRIVDDFLDISAIEAGKFDLHLQRERLDGVMKKSLSLSKHQADKKGVELEVRITEPLPLTRMDASKIEQVMVNLVSNAIEHSPPATPVVIELTHDPEWVRFCVTDSGPGVLMDEAEKLFKPFETTGVKKTGKEKSTGLGLAIARKIIDAHQGQIWVKNSATRGAIFGFNLPITGFREPERNGVS